MRFDFRGLTAQGSPVADGDTAFDEEIFEPLVEELIPSSLLDENKSHAGLNND
jgi:tRNA 2-thiocytidine biosynthesis protein TtcA